MILVTWGQFLTHDIEVTPQLAEGVDNRNISIPKCDANLDK